MLPAKLLILEHDIAQNGMLNIIRAAAESPLFKTIQILRSLLSDGFEGVVELTVKTSRQIDFLQEILLITFR